MNIRDLVIFGIFATSLVGTPASMADDAKPLPAGGPSAESVAGLTPGTYIEIGGVLFAVTVGGLVAVNSDHNKDNPLPTVSTVATSSTSST